MENDHSRNVKTTSEPLGLKEASATVVVVFEPRDSAWNRCYGGGSEAVLFSFLNKEPSNGEETTAS